VPHLARLYVSAECGKCSQLAGWLHALKPVGLEIVAAEEHPERDLTRMTYDPQDGTAEQSGIAALARAFEHINFGWALLGMAMRLPKRSDLSGYAQSELDKIALRLNQRPRKTLGFETPASRLRASVAPTHGTGSGYRKSGY